MKPSRQILVRKLSSSKEEKKNDRKMLERGISILSASAKGSILDNKSILHTIDHESVQFDYFFTKEVRSRLNFFYDIIDSSERLSFRRFNAEKMYSLFILFLNVLLTFFTLPLTVVLFIGSFMNESGNFGVGITAGIALIAVLLASVAGWMLLLVKRQLSGKEPVHYVPQSFQTLISKHHWLIHRTFLLSLHILSIAYFLAYFLPTGCTHSLVLDTWGCETSSRFQSFSLLLMFVLPQSACFATKEPHWWFCLLGHTSLFWTLLGLLLQEFDLLTTLSLILWWIGASFLSFEWHKQNILDYYLTSHLKEALAINVNSSEQLQAQEMKHMIANVAHDLKTPLTSFTSGMDYIAQLLSDFSHDCDRHLDEMMQIPREHDNTVSDEEVQKEIALQCNHSAQATITSILSHLHNLRSTNTFMVMAINRILDYTKASKGMKLVPRFETISLAETLSMPFQCISNLHDQHIIHLLPIPKTICSHIITDKQWLQENILCLLSNAVKYSTGGMITVQISLLETVEREEEGEAGVEAGSQKRGGGGGSSKKVTSIDHQPSFLRFSQILSRRLYSSSSSSAATIFPAYRSLREREGGGGIRNNNNNNNNRKSSIDEEERENDDDSDALPSIRGWDFTPSRRYLTTTDAPMRRHSMASSASSSSSSKMSFQLKIEVEDQGIGMSEEAMLSLFQPFKQTQRLTGGTGLGLYSLAKRMEALKGQYGVTKRRDGERGSLFWFTIPYRPDKSAMEEALAMVVPVTSSSSPSASSTAASPSRNMALKSQEGISARPPKDSVSSVPFAAASSSSVSAFCSGSNINTNRSIRSSGGGGAGMIAGVKVLIVDDTPSILKMSAMMLQRHGAKIETAQNGALAVQRVEESLLSTAVTRRNEASEEEDHHHHHHPTKEEAKTSFDAILMDLQMPIMDGLEATRRIRAFEARLRQQHQQQQVVDSEKIISEHMEEKGRGKRGGLPPYHHLIIGVSANSDPDTTAAAYAAGIDHFMEKPFSMELFQQTLRRYSSLPSMPTQSTIAMSASTTFQSRQASSDE